MRSDIKPGMFKYCVVGNIVREHVDEEGITRNGIVVFPGGRKVYISRLLWDYGAVVLGLNRWHSRFILECIPLELIENIRPSRTFKRSVIDLMDDPEMPDGWWRYKEEDRIGSEEYAAMLNRIKAGDNEAYEKYKNEVMSEYC